VAEGFSIMHFLKRRSKARSGFTLIELLVVIAIIALLVSILLPALSRAKALAKTVVCTTNLRGIGMAVINYAQDNQDIMVPWKIEPDAANGYPDGDFWSYMLVRGGYVSAPNATKTPASQDKSIFRCPLGTDGCAMTIGWTGGDNHRTPDSYMWRSGDWNDTAANIKEIGGVAVRTWYTLNAGNYSAAPSRWGTGADWGAFQRISRFRRTSELVMGFDGNCANASWKTVRFAGRHPTYSADGLQGTCNMVFFDGHAKGFSTSRFAGVDGGSFYDTTILFADADHGTE